MAPLIVKLSAVFFPQVSQPTLTPSLTDDTAKPSLGPRHGGVFGELSVYSSPFFSNACFELREQELVVEAVDGRDVGEDPRDDVLRDTSFCELSAKFLPRKTGEGVYKTENHAASSHNNTHLIWPLFMMKECKYTQRGFHVAVHHINIFSFFSNG